MTGGPPVPPDPAPRPPELSGAPPAAVGASPQDPPAAGSPRPLRPRGGFNVVVRDPAVRAKLRRRAIVTALTVVGLSVLVAGRLYLGVRRIEGRQIEAERERNREFEELVGRYREVPTTSKAAPLGFHRHSESSVSVVLAGQTLYSVLAQDPRPFAVRIVEVAKGAEIGSVTVERSADLSPEQEQFGDRLFNSVEARGVHVHDPSRLRRLRGESRAPSEDPPKTPP